MYVILDRDMKIVSETHRKRAAALSRNELDPLKKFVQTQQKAPINIIKETTLNSALEYTAFKITFTNALAKVRYPAAAAKIWQNYHDSRVGVRQSRRSMVRILYLI